MEVIIICGGCDGFIREGVVVASSGAQSKLLKRPQLKRKRKRKKKLMTIWVSHSLIRLGLKSIPSFGNLVLSVLFWVRYYFYFFEFGALMFELVNWIRYEKNGVLQILFEEFLFCLRI